MAAKVDSSVIRLSLVMGVAGFCAACNSMAARKPRSGQMISGAAGTSTPVANPNAVGVGETLATIDCPQIEVQDGRPRARRRRRQ